MCGRYRAVVWDNIKSISFSALGIVIGAGFVHHFLLKSPSLHTLTSCIGMLVGGGIGATIGWAIRCRWVTPPHKNSEQSGPTPGEVPGQTNHD